MSEKFISYDNLKQYDEFLDQELQNIKQHIDDGFTYNVKYAESNEIGGAALKAISDENSENIAEHFDNIENDIAINKTTLGYQKKNLMKLIHAPGYSQTNTAKSVTWTFNSDYSISMVVTTALTSGMALEHSRITLQPGTYIYSVEGYSTPNITHTQLYSINTDGTDNWLANYSAIENTLTVTEETTYSFRAYRNSAVTTGVTETFYPMVRYAEITDDTFKPYVESIDERLQNFIKSGSDAKAGLVPAPSTIAGTTKYLREDGTWQIPPDNNTHYTSKNVVGSKTATTNTTAALTNGNVYLNSVENGAVTSAHKISGSGATTVTTDTSGNIIIDSTDTNTDTKVTQTVKTNDANYPLLCAPSGQTTTTTTTTYFDSGVALNPSTNTITANISGTAAKATSDKNGKDITTTYLPLAGGIMDDNASIRLKHSIDGRYTDYKHNIKMTAPNAGWSTGISYYLSDGKTKLGDIGAHGDATALNYFYIGPSYSDTYLKLDTLGNGTFKGSVTATSFKTSGGTNPLVTGSVAAENFNGSTGSPKTLTITVPNLNYYSTLYLELGHAHEGYITGSIPISYLLNNTGNSIYLQASLTEPDCASCWCEITASGNNIYINSPQYTQSNYYSSFTYSLTYKIFKI